MLEQKLTEIEARQEQRCQFGGLPAVENPILEKV